MSSRDVCARYGRWAGGVVIGMAIVAAAQVAQAASFSEWTRELNIAYPDLTPGTVLTNFPVLVTFSETVPGFFYDELPSPPESDLRFSDASGTNELAYEVDEWHPAGTSYVWVRVPALTNGAVVRAFWRNPSPPGAPAYTTNGAVWADGFIGVWHMREAYELPVDSALIGGDHSATNSTNYGAPAVGRVGRGTSFDGNSLINIAHAADLAGLTNATAEFWYYKRSPGGGNYGTVFGTPSHDWGLRHLNTDSINVRLGNSIAANSGILTNDAWHHLIFTYDDAADRVVAYHDGRLVNSGSTTQTWMNTTHLVGSGTLTDRAVDGILDEMRYASVTRSAEWVRAAYLTSASNDTFSAYGVVYERDADASLPRVTNAGLASRDTTNAWVTGYLTSTGTAATTVHVYWDTVDGGTDTLAWAHAETFPAPTAPGAYVAEISGLSAGSLYYYRFAAENANGFAWARRTDTFTTIGPPLIENAGATPHLAYSRLGASVIGTNGAPTYGTIYWGTADGGTNATAWEHAIAFPAPVETAFAGDTRPRVNWGTDFADYDIGNPGLAGSSYETNGARVVTGSGTDIYGFEDHGHFVVRPVEGDFDVACRVGDFTGGTETTRKGGIMLRASLEANSRHAAVLRTPTNGSGRIVFSRRNYEGGTTISDTLENSTNATYWLRLVRDGEVCAGYLAEDLGGTRGSWSMIGTRHAVRIEDPAYLCLAVTAHNDAQRTTVPFDSFEGDVPGRGDLFYGVPYYYRCQATNAYGDDWANASAMFVTAPPDGIGVANGRPADVTPDSVTCKGTLYGTGSVFNVSLLWGPTDGGGDAAAWAHTNRVGTYTNEAALELAVPLTGLAPGTLYGTFVATNAATNIVAAPTTPFQVLTLPVTVSLPATNVTDRAAVLRGRLDVGGTATASFYWGTSDGAESVTAWEHATAIGDVVALETFESTIDGLLANNAYYQRTYVTNASGADWADASTVFTTAPPTVVVADCAVLESDEGTAATASFSVTLSAPSAIPVSLHYTTADGSAAAGVDFVAAADTLTIPAGVSNATIAVHLIGDKEVDALPLKQFTLRLDSPVACTLANAQAVGTIRDDDLDTALAPWAYRMKISFTGYTGTEPLTNFPALVVFDPASNGFSYAQLAFATGDDLRFADGNLLRLLHHDIDTWNTGGRSYVWVSIPVLAGTNTTIWAYWGNAAATSVLAGASATWGDEFLGVYHLGDDDNDSTANTNHGYDAGGTITRVDAIAGRGVSLSGGTRVELPGGARWDRIDSDHDDVFTLSAWVRPNTVAADQAIFGRFPNQHLVWLDAEGLANYVVVDGHDTSIRTSETSGGAATANTWQHVVATGDGVTLRVYVDGRFGSQSAGGKDYTFVTSTQGISLGTNTSGDRTRALSGILDEARIAAVCRTADWIAAEYYNVAANGTFNAYRTVEQLKPGFMLFLR